MEKSSNRRLQGSTLIDKSLIVPLSLGHSASRRLRAVIFQRTRHISARRILSLYACESNVCALCSLLMGHPSGSRYNNPSLRALSIGLGYGRNDRIWCQCAVTIFFAHRRSIPARSILIGAFRRAIDTDRYTRQNDFQNRLCFWRYALLERFARAVRVYIYI